jgi:hypothetical protein
MDFGIALAPAADSWKTVQRAERLGYSHAWLYDTQLLCADVFVAMAVAAANTERITIGPGVLVQFLLAASSGLLGEALALRLRRKPWTRIPAMPRRTWPRGFTWRFRSRT